MLDNGQKREGSVTPMDTKPVPPPTKPKRPHVDYVGEQQSKYVKRCPLHPKKKKKGD